MGGAGVPGNDHDLARSVFIPVPTQRSLLRHEHIIARPEAAPPAGHYGYGIVVIYRDAGGLVHYYLSTMFREQRAPPIQFNVSDKVRCRTFGLCSLLPCCCRGADPKRSYLTLDILLKA